ncbi:MAG: hypothetical protein FJX23_08915, partial [Alphaproteobacteria bacterium]|nr:hypothetical protein [Alphaproteobacteria bacterium]
KPLSSPTPQPQKQLSLCKRVGHRLEWCILASLLTVFSWLPMSTAAGITGFLGKVLGRIAPQSNRARRNLQLVFPHQNTAEREAIVSGMCESMGRYFGELAHVGDMSAEQFRTITEIVGEEHYHAAVNDPNGSLFFSAHMANWEWGAKTAWVLGTPFSIVYRPLNNPLIEAVTTGIRNKYQRTGIPKSGAGGRELISTLKRGEPVAILIDQKMSSGRPIPFFGHDAPTSTSLADMALKYGSPIVPTRVERIGKHRFLVTFEPPLDTVGKDAVGIMQEAHSVLERWISERPEQWFWVHRRWGKI